MSYLEQTFLPHLRIALLRVLDEAPSCKLNSSILTLAVDGLGLAATRDQVKAQLGWLEEQGLVHNEQLGDLKVATLTERGGDVAAGRARVDGVQRPTPRG